MNKWIASLLLLLCLSNAAVFAQDMARVRQTIDTLASKSMYGRGYTFNGDRKAAEYIRHQFEEMALAPIGNSYFQHFSFPVNRILETPILLVDGKALTPGQDFVARAASPSGEGTLAAIMLDTMVFSDAKAARKFFKKVVEGIALVYEQKDQRRLQQLQQQYQKQIQRAKLHIVLQKGALLTTVARQQEPVPVLEVAEAAWPKQAKKVSFSIKAELNPQHQAQNVITLVRGSQQPDSVIVFSAHYDHLGSQGEGIYFPGANDNASGTAMLLELARHYSQPQNRPRYSIVFMAFAAEEAGLLGSLYYTQHPLFPLQNIRFLVNLDLLGTGSEGMMAVNGKVHEEEFQLLQQLNNERHYLPQIKSRGKAANSDHYPFSEAGVPAFFFYTLGGTSAYHNTNDFASQLPLTKFPEVFGLIKDFADTLMQQSQGIN